MWRMRTITFLFGLWIATFVLFRQGTNEHTINAFYGCDVPLDCRDKDGVWYHDNRSISNTSLQSVGFDDAGHYQCKNPSNAEFNKFTLHVYGLQGVAAVNCNSALNGVCVRNVISGQPVTLCAAFTTFPSSVSEKYTSNLLDIEHSRWEESSVQISQCKSENDCQEDTAYHFNNSLKWWPCLTVPNVTEDLRFGYVINTHDVATDDCPATSGVVQSKAEFSVHVLDTPTDETTSISSSLAPSSSLSPSHPSIITDTPVITPSSSSHPSNNTDHSAAAAIVVPIMVIIVTLLVAILIACMICRTRGGRDCSSVEDDKDNFLDLRIRNESRRLWKRKKSSQGPVLYVVTESTMDQLHLGSTEEDAGYGNTASSQFTPTDGAITEQSLASMGTCIIPPLTSSPPCERSQMVRPDSLWIKGEGKVDSGVSMWTSPSNSTFGPGLDSSPSGGPELESSPSGGPGLESSPSGGPVLDSNLSDKPLIPGDSDDVSENDFLEGFHTNVHKT